MKGSMRQVRSLSPLDARPFECSPEGDRDPPQGGRTSEPEADWTIGAAGSPGAALRPSYSTRRAHENSTRNGSGGVARSGNTFGGLRCRREEIKPAAGAHEGVQRPGWGQEG